MTDRYERIRGALAMEPTIVDRVNAAAAKVSDVLMEARNAARDELLWLAAQYRELLAERDALTAEVERLAEALRKLEEREQRDEALLRQALEALELRCGTHADERKELIPALRERLGVKT